ncbi:chemotaxis protein CheB [Flaviaesturariibacter amylovorans]|uniref:protein-glutamate methylesterase n=1 Tax=Flaviaesturariibacter amylovorans TaxID=1084520 RepID=A0ABP8HN20_9BACT
MAKDRVAEAVLVIGGSAGSLEVLLTLLPGLRKGLPFAIVIVMHRNRAESQLAALLASRCALPVREAEDKDPLHAATILIAPAGYHLLLEANGTVSLDCSEKVNYSRPSIDVTFDTAADVFGTRAAGLLLSGANLDGVDGLARIHEAGGTVLAQEPATAQVSYMPQGAVDRLAGIVRLAPADMAEAINRMFGA